MKKLYTSALILLLLGSVFTQDNVAGSQIFEKGLPRVGLKYVSGEFIVKFKPSVTEQTITSLNSTHGVSTIYTSPYTGFRRLRTPSGKTVAEIVEIYQANSNVEYAEANYIAYALKAPNDELYPLQWHLYNTSYGGIQAESAWDISTGSEVVVAILDTGIAYEDYCEKNPTGLDKCYQQAPDLADTYFLAGYDFVNSDEHPNDDSISGHGTHIAGTIAQNTKNGIGTAGVAFNAYLMPVKVLDSSGTGTYADIAEGIIWATENGAHVINLGLGGTEPSRALENAIAYSYNRGVTLIAAAGNDGVGGVCYPAAYDDYVIAVGATRYDETLAYYSNYGLNLDLVAPGGDLNVDQNKDGYGDGILQQTYNKDGGEIFWGYCFMEGTSMAAAHVSAVAALLIAHGNTASPAEVREALESTAEDKGPISWDVEYGWGIVDAYAALQWKATKPGPGPGPGPLPLTAEFTAEPTIGPEQMTVQFTDQSTGNITSWSWDFGDGTESTDRNPAHTYQDAGYYTVRLEVVGTDGSDTKIMKDYIHLTMLSVPVANFTAKPKSGDSPLVVQFTETTTGHVSNRLWDFGDGTTSAEQNPTHTYTCKNIADYTVSLSVTGMDGSDTETKTNYIHLNTPPIYVNIGMSKRHVMGSLYVVTAGITVTQNTPTGLPIGGATVEGTWSGGYGGTVSGITNANGGISFVGTQVVGSGSSVTFTINKVIIGSKEYDFAGQISSSIGI